MDHLQIDRLVAELELTRLVMAELTDALRLQTFRTQELTAATNALNAQIEVAQSKPGFWKRLAGG